MAAKVEQPVWSKEGSEKREAVQRMFSEIAPTYDLVNSLISLKLHTKWRKRAADMLQLTPGDRALDVCSGTGDFLPILKDRVGTNGAAVGIDFCQEMLQKASEKYASDLSLGDACQLPIQSSKFDGVTVGWGIRNVPDIDLAHREILRVLKPGGRFVSVDMAQPQNPVVGKFSKFVFHSVVPKIGTLFGKTKAYTYLPKSTERFMSRENLMASMQKAGFIDVRTTDLFFGNICIHFGRKP